MKTQSAILIIVAPLLVASYVMGEQGEIDAKQANYCEMRSIYKNTGGEYGWPKLDGYGECQIDQARGGENE